MDPHHHMHHADRTVVQPVDWPATCRLGLLASGLAGLAAAALHGVISDSAIIAWVVVASGTASWLRLDRHLGHVWSH
jgi:hypothetical protein